jgi:glucose-6-phosphate isomerase
MRAAVLEPIIEFTLDVKAGRVPAEQAALVLEELAKARVVGPVIAPVFQKFYIDPSHLSPEEKEILARDLSRYAEGLRVEKIPERSSQEIWALISEPQPGTGNDPDTRHLKKSLTPEELKTVMEIMRTTAEQAGIAEQIFTFQPGDEVRQAIQRGLLRGGAGKAERE